MDLDQLKQILDLVREHELSEFEIEHDGMRLKIRKDAAGGVLVPPAAAPVPLVAAVPSTASVPAPPAGGPASAPAGASADSDIELVVVTAEGVEVLTEVGTELIEV